MVSNNVWVEATVHPDSALNIQTYIGDYSNLRRPEPLDKLHVTMAFTKLNADLQEFETALLDLRDRLMKSVSELPSLEEHEVTVGGSAILQPGKGDFGVLLLSSQLLWSYYTGFARELTKDDTLDLSYPGWLPHVTLSTSTTTALEQETIHRTTGVGTIQLDGLWLRAGRICVPL